MSKITETSDWIIGGGVTSSLLFIFLGGERGLCYIHVEFEVLVLS